MQFIDFMRIAAYIIMFGALWRLVTVKAADTRLGSAMAFIY